MILKTEQTTIVYAQWDRWTSQDVIKHMITTDVVLKSKTKEESALLRTGLSRSISKLSIIFNLKSSLSLVKIEKFSKDGEQLQHKRCSQIVVSLLLSISTFFPVRCEMPKCSQIRTLKWHLVFPIVFPEDSLQMTNFKMKCLEIATYVKTLME